MRRIVILLLLLCGGCAGSQVQQPGPRDVSMTPATSDLSTSQIVVADASSSAVVSYGEKANGNARPRTSIRGSLTRLDKPEGVAVYDGHMWVANVRSIQIPKFHRGDNGNVAPTNKIVGDLKGNTGIAMDGTGVYVTNIEAKAIYVYGPTARHHSHPAATIQGLLTGLAAPRQIALDAMHNIFVAEKRGAILEFAARSDGNVAPIRTITGPDTGLDSTCGVALGVTGEIYASNTIGSIVVYAPEASGDDPPIRVIQGSLTRLESPCGLAIDDATGSIFAANGRSIVSYPIAANGNIAPSTWISGNLTLLQDAIGLTLAR